jgi:CheY-like chemotaxis protein
MINLPRHLLIVDDEDEIRFLLRKVLTNHGYRVTDVASALEARKVVATDRPALIICDLQLQESDGLVLLRELRQILPGVPTILLTGVLFDEKVAASTLGNAVTAYVPKPAKLSRIVEVTRQLLGDAPRAVPPDQGA